MLTIKYIQEHKDEVICRLAVKGFQAGEIVGQAFDMDMLRKKLQTQADNFLSEINAKSKEIGQLMKSGQKELAETMKQEVSELKERAAGLVHEQEAAEQKLKELLVLLPNLPHESVPQGKTAGDNVVVREGGVLPELPSDALPHWELAKKYELIDFELGVKITGAGFPVYKGKGARLQRALISFFLDRAQDAGYREVIPPLMVNEDSAFGTGQLPDKEGQMYHAGLDNFYLIPTAEVPV
ncbi:MAG: serine--tRNA ligase, partial [Bacteroidales bacterium]|nr:serine--tRNA ligase [Bacteroidales bacterium]